MSSLWTWLVVGVVAWVALVALALCWLANAAQAGEQFDQVMADHYRYGDNPENQT